MTLEFPIWTLLSYSWIHWHFSPRKASATHNSLLGLNKLLCINIKDKIVIVTQMPCSCIWGVEGSTSFNELYKWPGLDYLVNSPIRNNSWWLNEQLLPRLDPDTWVATLLFKTHTTITSFRVQCEAFSPIFTAPYRAPDIADCLPLSHTHTLGVHQIITKLLIMQSVDWLREVQHWCSIHTCHWDSVCVARNEFGIIAEWRIKRGMHLSAKRFWILNRSLNPNNTAEHEAM